MKEREDPIVVTGMGTASPLGVGVRTNWRRLIEGRSGIVANTRFDVTDYACKVAGLVPLKEDDPEGFDPADFMDKRDIRKTDLFIHYAMAAAAEAVGQAGWTPDDADDRARTAVSIATGVGGLPAITGAVDTIRARGPRRLSPFVVPSFLPNWPPGTSPYGTASPGRSTAP